MPKSPQTYNTNLASEFHVLSMLFRRGLDANLTLGNKKAVDIVVAHGAGQAITIDVKAVAGKNDWMIGTPVKEARPRHFVVLVGYEGAMQNLKSIPRTWVLPHEELLRHAAVSKIGNLCYLSRKRVHEMLKSFEDAWELLDPPVEATRPGPARRRPSVTA